MTRRKWLILIAGVVFAAWVFLYAITTASGAI